MERHKVSVSHTKVVRVVARHPKKEACMVYFGFFRMLLHKFKGHSVSKVNCEKQLPGGGKPVAYVLYTCDCKKEPIQNQVEVTKSGIRIL